MPLTNLEWELRFDNWKKKRYKLEYNINGERQMKIDSLDLTLHPVLYTL